MFEIEDETDCTTQEEEEIIQDEGSSSSVGEERGGGLSLKTAAPAVQTQRDSDHTIINTKTKEKGTPKRRFRRVKPIHDSSSSEDEDQNRNKIGDNTIQDSDITSSCTSPNKLQKQGVSSGSKLRHQQEENIYKSRNKASGAAVAKDIESSIEDGDTDDTSSCGTRLSQDQPSPKKAKKSAQNKEIGDPDTANRTKESCKDVPFRTTESEKEQEVSDSKSRNESDGSELGETSDDDGSSTTSSDSLPDAENPLNTLDISENMNDDCEIADPIDKNDIPICSSMFPSRNKRVEVLIYSGTEFSVEVYINHPQTGKRRIWYPTVLIENFLALPKSTRRFEGNRFIFVITLRTFSAVKQAILPYWKNFEFDGIENVIHALVKYSHLKDEKTLDEIGYKFVEIRVSKFQNLRPYQKESVLFAYLRQGRCMLADASGMGKRVESIITCYLYEDEWPVIIICSTSQQQHWVSLLKDWLPKERRYNYVSLETPDHVQEYMKNASSQIPDFTVIGYTLLRKGAEQLKTIKFKIVIIDESHKIKHAWTSAARSARKIIKRAKRRLLLTSNPAFGVPDELFCQLHVIDRKAFQDCTGFADRYCGFEQRFDPRTERVKQIASRNWRNAKNLEELKFLLHNTVMIRHFKTDDLDVIHPERKRELVRLDFRPDERTKRILGEIYQESRDCLDDLLMDSDTHRRAEVFVWFKKSGKAKVSLICKYLDNLDMTGRKIIIYARHVFVLDGIERLLDRKGIEFVRIRGDYQKRIELSEEFDSNPDIRVALLSLNISQVGVNLTKADMVIFTELYWLPDSILRNEDRAWDFFQSNKAAKKALDIKYLIAYESNSGLENQIHMDAHLWEILEGKIHVLEKLGLMKDDFTTNVPEVVFQAESSTAVDDLKFSDISSNESDHEYNPNGSELSNGENESEMSSLANTDELSSYEDENSSHNSSGEGKNSPLSASDEEIIEHCKDKPNKADKETRPSDSDSEAGNTSEDQSDDELNRESPIDKQPPRRITRSQSVLEKTNDEETESDSSTESASERSISDFIVDSSEEADDESDDKDNENDDDKNTSERKSKRKKKTRKTSSGSDGNERDDDSSNSSRSSQDSLEFEKKVKRARRSFMS